MVWQNQANDGSLFRDDCFVLPVSGHDDVTDPEVVIDENEGEKDDIIDEKDPSDDDEDAEGW